MQPSVPRDPTRQRLELPGVTLSYTDEGTGPVIIALSGLPGAHHHWRWLATPLFDWARFIRLELPGFGDSRMPGPVQALSVQSRGELVARAIEALGVAPVSLVGHSMGALIALEVAARHPRLVRTVTLVASPGPTPHYPAPLWKLLATAFSVEFAQPVMSRLAKAACVRLGLSVRDMNSEGALRTIIDAAATDFARHRQNIALVRQPVLQSWGRDDRLVPQRFHEALTALRPDWKRLEFSDGGHDVQKFHAVELSAAMRELG